MKRMALVALTLLINCREEQAHLPLPVDITREAAGYYCQMELVEHDGPKAQIHLDGLPAPIFFSQVRDAVAYLHMPEQSYAVTVTYVQDMTGAAWEAPGPWIKAQSAHFVIGSDRMGGMGAPEFVPFATEQAATEFSLTHGGEVRPFAGIRAEDALTTGVVHDSLNQADEVDMTERLRRLSGERDG